MSNGVRRFKDDLAEEEGNVFGRSYRSKINGGEIYIVHGLVKDLEGNLKYVVAWMAGGSSFLIEHRECMLDVRVDGRD